MRAGLGISIGIAAIDTLLSAFTALLILSLALMSPAVSGGSSAATDTELIAVEKIQESGSLDVELTIDIESIASGGSPVSLVSATHSEIMASAAPHLLARGGRVVWSDCVTTGSKCTSLLVVTKPAGPWRLRLRIAGTRERVASPPDKLGLKVRRLSGPTADLCDTTLRVDGQVVVDLHFGAARSLACYGKG